MDPSKCEEECLAENQPTIFSLLVHDTHKKGEKQSSLQHGFWLEHHILTILVHFGPFWSEKQNYLLKALLTWLSHR